MNKIYIVRLCAEERQTCLAIVKKLKGSSQTVRRANILLKADADGPNWKDQDIAEAGIYEVIPYEISGLGKKGYYATPLIALTEQKYPAL